ncbi:MAG: DUF3857 domain-containing protein [Ferruginibacter sp.]
MKFFTLPVVIILTAGFANVTAQSKDSQKYRKESEEMRKTVWAWDMPQFKATNVPAEYAKASKVVLAQHTELTADSKSKIVYTGFAFGAKKELSISEVVREMVKLNDKTAIDDYSELSFTQFEKRSAFFGSNKVTAFVGVRIIKPNGKVTEINADDIVLTKDESKEKKAKLAIPDLEPGDIIDYFIATEKLLENDFSTKVYNVILFDEAPILSLSFHGQLGKKFAVDYRSYNGAPDLKVSKNDDKDIIIDVVKKNIPPFETALWVAPGLQLPFIRMNISLGLRGPAGRDANKPGEINKLTVSDEGINEKISHLASGYNNNYRLKVARWQFKEIVDDAEKKAKQMNLRFKDMSDKERAALLFYTFRYNKFLNFDISLLSKKIDIGNYRFDNNAINLYCILKAADIDASMLLSASRTGVRMNEAMDGDDINVATFLTGTPDYLDLEYVYDAPFVVPAQVEGLTDTKKLTFSDKSASAKSIETGPKVPVSSSYANAHIENLKLSLSADKNNIAVERSTTLKGLNKVDAQRALILYEDFYEEERKAFNDEKTLIESLEDDKKSKKYVDEVQSAFAGARKNQKDAFLEEAKGWFEQDITGLKNCKTDTLGVRHTAPNFVYSSSFTIGNLVKKAGNNMIVEIGKIEGQPLIIKNEQRKREIDAYMPYARSIEYNIEFEIPDGYTVEGLQALNKNVTNDAGFFIVEASATKNLVTVKIKKHYLHNFEPSKNWDKLVEFTDAAGDWANSKLLLKKG